MLKRLGHSFFVTIALTAILSTLFKFSFAATSVDVSGHFLPIEKEGISKSKTTDLPGLLDTRFLDESESGEEDTEEDSGDDSHSPTDVLLYAESDPFSTFGSQPFFSNNTVFGDYCSSLKYGQKLPVYILFENFRL